MKKNNNKISLHNIKRAKYVDRRKKRMNDEVNKKVKWLEHIVYAGENLDMSKIIDSARNIKQAKLIIDKLVSRNVKRTMSQKKEIKIAN